jgi:hypothetical protein
MEDLAFLRERIQSYADYTNDDDRRRCDEQVRAYLGEALARVVERLAPADPVAETLERVVLRCQFADQRVIRAFDVEAFDAGIIAALRQHDRELVNLADRAATLDAAALRVYVADVDAKLDARARLILTSAPAPHVPPF